MPYYPPPERRTVHIESAELPAAGAFTTQSAYAPAGGLPRHIAFWVTYTRGAANGRPTFRVEWDNGTEKAVEITLDQSLTTSGPYGQQNIYIQELIGPAPSDGTAITYTFSVENKYGAAAVRLLVAESGATGTPGVCAVSITGYS